METRSNVFKIVMTALMMGIIMVAILFIRVPIPFTQGYVHLGDAMIFLAVIILGWKYGAIAAAFGGLLGDIIGGFAAWAPWTFGIKAIMALLLGFTVAAFAGKKPVTRKKLVIGEIVGMIIAGIFMVIAYYFAEGVMYGNWATPVLGVPWNIGQFTVGLVIAFAISEALRKTPAKVYFAHKVSSEIKEESEMGGYDAEGCCSGEYK